MDTVAPDRMEATGVDFFRKVQEGYHQILEQNPDRCIKINAENALKHVFNEINQIILKRFAKELTCI